MGNTDIVTAPLSDANEKNTTEHSTIFDDVFRTIAQKMPQLLIPLINEVFHTSQVIAKLAMLVRKLESKQKQN